MESLKIIQRKKPAVVLVLLLVAQVLLFLYSAQGAGEDGQGASQVDADEFRQTIEEIMEQADSLAGISIFAVEDSFSSRNLEKTKSDYEVLLDVEPVAFDGRFLEVVLDNPVMDALLVMGALVVALALYDGERRGLRGMIFAASGGRGRLVLHKIGACFLWGAAMVFVCCGLTLLFSSAVYGGNLAECCAYPAQSLGILEKWPIVTTIGTFLLLFIICKAVVIGMTGWAAWCVLVCVDHMFVAMGVIAGVGILEYLLYAFVNPANPAAVVHYANFWYLLRGVSYFSEYRNLNFFGMPVNKDCAIMLCGVALAVVLFAASMQAGCRKYPCRSADSRFAAPGFLLGVIQHSKKQKEENLQAGKRHVEKHRLGELYSRVQKHLTPGLAELYKTLVSQRQALVVLLFVVIIVEGTGSARLQFTEAQTLYYRFIEEYTGAPGEGSSQYLSGLEETLYEVEETYTQALSQYEAGEITGDEFQDVRRYYESYEAEQEFLEMAQSQTEYLEELEAEKGIKGWYVNTYTYNRLLGSGDTLEDVMLMLCVVLICSGIFAKERVCGMKPVLRCAANGRLFLFRRKIRMGMMIAFCLSFLTEVVNIASVIGTDGIRGLGAPVQSLEALGFVPFSCCLGGFLGILFLLRVMMVLTVAACTCMASELAGQSAVVIIASVLCLPEILAWAGMDLAAYFSAARVVSVAPFLLLVRKVWVVTGVCLVFLMAGLLSISICRRSWCGSRISLCIHKSNERE